MESLTLTPIGFVRTPYTDRYRAPRQPGAATVGVEGTIELVAGHNFEQALEDLAGVERIWVLYWFHRNQGWKPKVLPPRGPRIKRGVFATRSPHRPNPLGLSVLRLLSVRGRTLRVADVDLLDGTPVLDLKPYLPYADAFPAARTGWLESALAAETPYVLEWSPLAAEQAGWLAEQHGIALAEVAEPVLARDPFPHPYRRIEAHAEGGFVLGLKSWRLCFTVEGPVVTITHLASGYAPAVLASTPDDALLEPQAHRAFHLRWRG
jgi:tRNA-Thr(GGU) m(6)t(6)A37 methyltransferase TsaA